jgi:starch-binding outer membrane protein SusE/F
VLDESTGMVYYTRVRQWAVIGDATDQGWSAEYPMEQTALSASSAEWQVTDLVLRERGGFKFRYNEGWKITTDDFVIFANLGAEPGTNNFRTGGDAFPYPDEGEGQYTVTLNWTLADGFSYTTERTGDVDPLPEYPAELYMIGDGVGSWEWDEVDIPMIPSAGDKDHLFWRVVWLEETGAFKFAEERAWVGDFGKTGEATDGVYEIGGEDIPVPGQAGYYMVVVNLETNQVAIADPQVYLIGGTLDGNEEIANPDARFTVDNENQVLTLTRELTAGELRMYAWFDAVDDWFTDWWQHEFMIFNGEIVYRGRGGDQERVQVEAGETTIELNFRNDQGSITQP